MSKTNTDKIYMNALMFACGQKQFTSQEFRKLFKVNHNLISAMYAAGYVNRVAYGQYQWIADYPTPGDLRKIKKHMNKRGSVDNSFIRKAPVSNPQPIVKEAEYDTSNSKMFLILAVGAIVGFMIATIIWR